VITQTGLFYLPGAKAQPIPRIFLVLAHKFLQAKAEKKLHRIKTRIIHRTERRQHHSRRHAISPQTDIAVTQCGIDDADFV
jgi:hypothetical protein